MPKIKLSNRARNTPPSPIRRLAHLAHKAKKSGQCVYHLNIGQPDIPSPKEYFEGMRLFDEPVLAYDDSHGNEELCSAWSHFINTSLDLSTRPEQFLITTGASEALVFLFMTCCDPGDEVIIFDPTYANYIGFAAVSGVTLVPILSKLEQGFALPDLSKIEEQITNRTRAILLCSPNNPTGTVYSKKELQSLLDLCTEHNFFLIVDETYREFVYDDLKPLSILQIAPDNERVIVVDSLSKRYSLCGARIGCLVTSNERVLATALNIAQARLAAPTIEQFAAVHMLHSLDENYLENVRKEYQARRDTLFDALKKIPDLVCTKPKGAFYAVARLPVEDTDDFAAFLLTDFSFEGRTTFVAPGSGFYMQNHRGKHKIRMAFVLEQKELEDAVRVLGKGLQAYVAKQ